MPSFARLVLSRLVVGTFGTVPENVGLVQSKLVRSLPEDVPDDDELPQNFLYEPSRQFNILMHPFAAGKRYDLDVNSDVGPAAFSGMPSPPPLPKVFIHELPDDVRIDPKCDNPECAFGPMMSDEDHESLGVEKNTLYATDQFQLGNLFEYRMRNYPELVSDMDSADVIYIPFFAHLAPLWYGEKEVVCANFFAYLEGDGIELMNESRKNIFVVIPRIGACEAVCHTAFPFHWIRMATEADLSIPYPSLAHPSGDWSTRFPLGSGIKSKDLLWSAYFGVAKGANRNKLWIDCHNEEEKCIYLKPTRTDGVDAGFREEDKDQWGLFALQKEPVDVLLRSVFNAQPHGHTCSRKGIFDSIVLGAIPIFFRYCFNRKYEMHLNFTGLTWEDASVFIEDHEHYGTPDTGESITQILEKIPEDRVKELYRNVKKLAVSFTYARETSRQFDDAFTIALRGVASGRHARGL